MEISDQKAATHSGSSSSKTSTASFSSVSDFNIVNPDEPPEDIGPSLISPENRKRDKEYFSQQINERDGTDICFGWDLPGEAAHLIDELNPRWVKHSDIYMPLIPRSSGALAYRLHWTSARLCRWRK